MIFSILQGSGTIQEKFIGAIAFVVSIVTAIVMHEVAHGFVALLNGDRTAKDRGRLSLNPAAHIDWSGAIMFLVVGIGWAKPVPINPNNFKKTKKGIVTVALAGVAMNFILAFVSFGLFLGVGAIFKKMVDMGEFAFVLLLFLYNIFFYGTLINLSLIAFNLLPLYPLDGFRVVEILTPPNNPFVVFLRRYSLYIFMGLIFLSFLPEFTISGKSISFDILGRYINAVRKGILWLFNLILGGNYV